MLNVATPLAVGTQGDRLSPERLNHFVAATPVSRVRLS